MPDPVRRATIRAVSIHPPAAPSPPQPPRIARLARSSAGAGERVLDLGRLLVGLAVVSLGVVWLLDAAGTLDASRTIDRWWPLVLVCAGIFTLLERPPAFVRGSVLTGAGVVLLLFTTDVLDDDAWRFVWPALVIAAGVIIAWRWRGGSIRGGVDRAEVLRTTAVFSGAKLASASREFRGAWLTAVFGGVKLDLREALPAPEGASVNATVAFGGAEIIVPAGWRISIRSLPIFGGVEDKTDHSVHVSADAPSLQIDAVTLFGGVEIKNRP